MSPTPDPPRSDMAVPPATCPAHGKAQLGVYVHSADKWTADYKCGCVITKRGPRDVTRAVPHA